MAPNEQSLASSFSHGCDLSRIISVTIIRISWLSFFLYILRFFVYFCVPLLPLWGKPTVLCHPRWQPPMDWQGMSWAGEVSDSHPGLLYRSQVRYHWATSTHFGGCDDFLWRRHVAFPYRYLNALWNHPLLTIFDKHGVDDSSFA